MGPPANPSFQLKPHAVLPRGKPVAVIVLDGWGEQIHDQYNATFVAPTPTMDALKQAAPKLWRTVRAHGPAVGLPKEDDMGNSEVGHNALGAGRIFEQGAGLVDNALTTKKLFSGEGFKWLTDCFEKGTLHLIGLLSDGGVHSRYDQLQEGFDTILSLSNLWSFGEEADQDVSWMEQMLLKGSAENGAKRIRVHFLTDGRDVQDGSSLGFVEQLEKDLEELRSGGTDAQIASGGGRMYVTMDRYENDWNVVKRGWEAQVLGEAPNKFTSAVEALKKLKEADPKVNDQYYPPFVIVDNDGKAVGPIVDGDAVVTFNYRADRMVMLAKALQFEDFDHFDRVRFPKIRYAGMMQYDGELKLPNKFLVSPPEIARTSGEYLAHNGVRTYACSETVKFGHVTFFWNGNRSGYFNQDYETYFEIPSDSDIKFNEKPLMKALEIAKKAKEALQSGKYDHVRVNFPNPDMVGHTGDLEATIEACGVVDKAIKVILDAVEEVGGIFLLTADHGNAEDMVKRHPKTGEPLKDKAGKLQILTAHTCAPVPLAIGGPGLHPDVRLRTDLSEAGLANVAATFINLLGFEAPEDYEPTMIEV
eukprot:SM000105S13868  [mRNA]  locus=s105:140737:143913:- [translate_table: standard]